MTGTLVFTNVIVPYDSWGTQRSVNADYTGPKSYMAGGDPVAGGDFKTIGTLVNVDTTGCIDASGNLRNVVYDAVNGTLRWYVATTGVEVVAGVDLSAFTGRVQAYGQ